MREYFASHHTAGGVLPGRTVSFSDLKDLPVARTEIFSGRIGEPIAVWCVYKTYGRSTPCSAQPVEIPGVHRRSHPVARARNRSQYSHVRVGGPDPVAPSSRP